MTVGSSPTKGSDVYVWAGLSSATKPANAFIGAKAIETDTGLVYEWDGANWCPRIGGVEIDSLVKSIPTTSTFHHLGHEGKVFIHTDRHDGVADAANDDILIIVPAGNADRQIHLRWAYKGHAVTGTLDADVILYKDTTVSANGDAEGIVSTNDAVVKSTGVTMFHSPTVTDIGSELIHTAILGENKGTGSDEINVPEWVLAPNGASARNYTMRVTNNSGGVLNYIASLFFYDSEAA
ncbi:hypothetical protein KAR91_09945 [Candidatus Pacearchaeota archaeon]|nr:hypothetical protein [Candidatus Pacearchaeota archaeon]